MGMIEQITENEARAILAARAADPDGYTKTLPMCEYLALIAHGRPALSDGSRNTSGTGEPPTTGWQGRTMPGGGA